MLLGHRDIRTPRATPVSLSSGGIDRIRPEDRREPPAAAGGTSDQGGDVEYMPTEVSVREVPLYIELSESGPDVTEGPTIATGKPEQLLGKLEAAGVAAGEACAALFRHMETALGPARPEEVNVEFGLTLGGEAGVPFVTKGSVGASFKVSATWKFAATTALNHDV